MKIRKLLQKIAAHLVPYCPRCRRDPYSNVTYSQDGEDCVLRSIFGQKKGGFYVDVGAHHPMRYSNTYHFYRHGWTGINIDPIPGTKELFGKSRPADITLECGVGDAAGGAPGGVDFYMFDEPAYNSFNPSTAEFCASRGFPKLVEKRKIPVYTLGQILDKYLPPGKQIDFLTVDAESWDFKVLASNNWERYKPQVVVVEDGKDAQSAQVSPIGELLMKNGYLLLAKTVNSAIHILRSDEHL